MKIIPNFDIVIPLSHTKEELKNLKPEFKIIKQRKKISKDRFFIDRNFKLFSGLPVL